MDWKLLNFDSLEELYNLHPMWVHFPVALLPCALLLFMAARLRNRIELRDSAKICLYLGTAGSLAADELLESGFPTQGKVGVLWGVAAWKSLLGFECGFRGEDGLCGRGRSQGGGGCNVRSA